MQTDPQPFELSISEAVTLRGDIYGQETGHTVVLLHGGGQTRHAWHESAEELARQGYRAITLDLRGHGESSWAPDADYSLDAFVGDIKALISQLDDVPSIVGASLGGLTALLAEGESPERCFACLVLVDVAPRIEPEGVARIIAFMSAHPHGFERLEDAAQAIARYLPHRRPPDDLSGLAKNLVLREDGRYHWHWDPAFLNGPRPPASVNQLDRFERAARSIHLPTLLVRGRISDLLSPAGAADFLKLVPHAEYVDVADAGHMVAGDSNSAFMTAVVDFISRLFK